MKAKLKFDKMLILGFLAQHGEKIAFGGVILVALCLVYFAMGGEKFEKSPDDLLKQANAAENKITASDSTVDAPIQVIQPSVANIKADPYAFLQPIDPPIYAPKTPRGEPELLSVEELRGKGGLGRLRGGIGGMGGAGAAGPGGTMMGPGAMGPGAMGPGAMGAGADPGKKSEPLGKRWIVVTGVIDYEKYQKLYQECFKNSRKHTQNDFYPVFLGFFVERAVVNDEDQPLEKLEWYQPYEDFWAEYKRYSAMTNLVNNRFFDPRKCLVFPVPQRSDGQEWGKEVAHPPQIPLAVNDTSMMGGVVPGETKGKASKDDPFGAAATGGPGGMQGRPELGGGEAYGGPGGNMLGGDDGGYNPAYGGGSGQSKAAPFLLFRFFDYNVEPGKRYRYRIQVVVANPNYGYSAQDLAKELRERMKEPGQWSRTLRSPWSDPSDVIAVPRDGRLLAASVTPGKGTREPVGLVMAIHWDSQTGNEIFDEFEIERGRVANFLDQEVPDDKKQKLPLGGPGMGGFGEEGMMGPGGPGGPGGPPSRHRRGSRRRAAQPEPETEKLSYLTEMLVVDLRGGEKLPGRNGMTAPGEILLLDPDGNFEVRDDSEDSQARREQKDPTRRAGQAAPGAYGPGGMEPMGPGGNFLEE